jgi:hypothetical protein
MRDERRISSYHPRGMRVWRSRNSKASTRADLTASVFTSVNGRVGPTVEPQSTLAPAPEEPVAALLVDAPDASNAPAVPEAVETPLETPLETPVAVAQLEMQSEFLRLLGVVTSMCDHVIEYIEADRAERRLMIETLSQLSRVITERTAEIDLTAEPFVARERVIGGSMAAGPEPIIDLCEREPALESDISTPGMTQPAATQPGAEPDIQLGIEPEPRTGDEREVPPATSIEIAVEVRGRFGDRWVDGFEICEVMTTPAGPRYRLRRNRDGVVLPELFDATSIRHVETFEQLNGDQLNGAKGYWSRS